MTGEVNFFPGFQIKQEAEVMCVHQTKYFKELLKKFKLEEAKEMKNPMHPTTSLELYKSYEKVDNTIYHQVIGSFLSYNV